jgi:GT2 family glycosyltransferase
VRWTILTTVYDPPLDELRACLDSVDAQTVTDWQHVVVDDASPGDEIAMMIESRRHARRSFHRRARNGGIAAASTDGLVHAAGEFVVLFDHDDVILPHALDALDRAVEERSPGSVALLYSDHDLLRVDGRTTTPVYKPELSLERLRNHNYITHLVAVRRDVLESIGGFRSGVDGAQDHDLLLRVIEHAADHSLDVVHVPEVLVHWRQSRRSVAASVDNKRGAFDAGVRVVQEHLDRVGLAATVEPGDHPGVYRVRRHVVGTPTVSVVIPTRGSRGRVWGCERIFVHDAVGSLFERHEGAARLELVVVVDAVADDVVVRGLRRIVEQPIVVEYDRPFDFAEKVNLGVAASRGEYVLLLNDDTELIAPASVDEMVGLAQQPDVGMVGAKLLFADGTLQHGGHVYNAGIDHALTGWPGDHPGPNRVLCVEREVGGVTAAAALLRRDTFDQVGGMSTAFPVNYNDVDLSMKVRGEGLRIVWTPHASWFHFEQRTAAHPIEAFEVEAMIERWGPPPWHDPFYAHPALHQDRADWLELPGCSGAPPYEVGPDGTVTWA